jgi:hypothetical protein
MCSAHRPCTCCLTCCPLSQRFLWFWRCGRACAPPAATGTLPFVLQTAACLECACKCVEHVIPATPPAGTPDTSYVADACCWWDEETRTERTRCARRSRAFKTPSHGVWRRWLAASTTSRCSSRRTSHLFVVMSCCDSYGFACTLCVAAGGCRRELQLQCAATSLFCPKPLLCRQLSEMPVAEERMVQLLVILPRSQREKLLRWRTFYGLRAMFFSCKCVCRCE